MSVFLKLALVVALAFPFAAGANDSVDYNFVNNITFVDGLSATVGLMSSGEVRFTEMSTPPMGAGVSSEILRAKIEAVRSLPMNVASVRSMAMRATGKYYQRQNIGLAATACVTFFTLGLTLGASAHFGFDPGWSTLSLPVGMGSSLAITDLVNRPYNKARFSTLLLDQAVKESRGTINSHITFEEFIDGLLLASSL